MTTISFTVPQSVDISKIVGMLKIFEVENITTTTNEEEKLPNFVIEGIKKGMQEIDEGKGIPSNEVHQEMRKYLANV